jgi:hypothetical protein
VSVATATAAQPSFLGRVLAHVHSIVVVVQLVLPTRTLVSNDVETFDSKDNGAFMSGRFFCTVAISGFICGFLGAVLPASHRRSETRIREAFEMSTFKQYEISLPAARRGCHLVTKEVIGAYKSIWSGGLQV